MVKKGCPFPDIAALLAGGFNEETARKLYAQGEEIAIFVMLQLAALAMKPNAINDGNQVDGNTANHCAIIL